MNITLVETKIEQLDALAKLFNQYMIFYKKPPDETRYKNYLKARIENNEATIYIAYNDKNVPLGFVLNYYSFSSVSQGRIVVLNDLFVLSEYRKNGIAEKLIYQTFELAKQVEAIRVDLGTSVDNYSAQRLYEKIGFSKDEDFFAYSYII